jgi:hypothetical protein
LKNLIGNDSDPVPTYSKVFKFDVSLDNIKRMTSFMIEKTRENAKRIHIEETSPRSK